MVRRRRYHKSGWDTSRIGARHRNSYLHVAQPLTWGYSMIHSKYIDADSWFLSQQPPYPPAPFPHASGGKGEQCTDFRQSISHLFVTRVCGLGSVNAYWLTTDSPFPSACVGERAGVRGAVNLSPKVSLGSTLLLFVLIVFGLTACQST